MKWLLAIIVKWSFSLALEYIYKLPGLYITKVLANIFPFKVNKKHSNVVFTIRRLEPSKVHLNPEHSLMH